MSESEFRLKPCIFTDCKRKHTTRDHLFIHLMRHHRKSELASKLIDYLEKIEKFPRLLEAIT